MLKDAFGPACMLALIASIVLLRRAQSRRGVAPTDPDLLLEGLEHNQVADDPSFGERVAGFLGEAFAELFNGLVQ